MTDTRHTTRRRFLGQTAIAGLPLIFPSAARGREEQPAASERVTVAGIGGGRRGRQILAHFLQRPEAQVVAMCDVNRRTAEARKKEIDAHYGNASCAILADFRELLARDDIDAVFVTVPTHWHVLITIEALRRGKHVYMEKPIGLSIEQAQKLRAAVHRYGRVFQLGTQQKSFKNFRFGCELVRNGRIGKLQRVEVGVPGGMVRPTYPEEAVPDWLDFDMWLGPAPTRPFSSQLLNPMHHEMMSDYVSAGFMIAWGIHHLDIAQWGAGTELTGPTTVEGTAVFPESGLLDTPLSWNVVMEYASGVELSFTDNRKNPQGVIFRGDAGRVHVWRGGLRVHPQSLVKETIGENEVRLPGHGQEHESHPRNFLDAVRGIAEPNAPIDTAVRSDALCHLSEIAVRLGRKVTWDAKREMFVDDATANRLLTSYPQRAPWLL